VRPVHCCPPVRIAPPSAIECALGCAHPVLAQTRARVSPFPRYNARTMAMSIGSRLSSAAPSHSSAVCATNLRTAARRYLHDSRVLTRVLYGMLTCFALHKWEAVSAKREQEGSGKWEAAVSGNTAVSGKRRRT
jgi:hypothetical protein